MRTSLEDACQEQAEARRLEDCRKASDLVDQIVRRSIAVLELDGMRLIPATAEE